MADGAKVTSIEALESFRASLIVYLGKARPSLEEIGSEVIRTRLWLENTQRLHWEAQVRRRAKELETARQDLFSAGMAKLRDTSASEIMAVRRAERALEEAENKLRLTKKWIRDFDSQAATLAKQLDKLETVYANDLPSAAAYLAQTIKTLSAYASGGPVPVLAEAPVVPRTESPANGGAASPEPSSLP